VPETEEQTKSKSQIKRELTALQDLGEQLTGLSVKVLRGMPLSEELREAVLVARNFKRNALRRQKQHIGVLMRNEDAETIRNALASIQEAHHTEVEAFHEREQWRDALLTGDTCVIQELVEKFPDFDRQHVNQLMRNAKKEKDQGKPEKSKRALFRYLRDL